MSNILNPVEFRPMARLCLVVLSIAFLSGCYESSSDLIGENANEIQKFDSVIVHDTQAYVVAPNGTEATLCSLNSRDDLRKACNKGETMKLERTALGNYIVQVKGFSGDRYNFALWFRTDQVRESTTRACVVWLGGGVVRNTSLISGKNDNKFDNAPAFKEFLVSLRGVATEPMIDRQQLLRIVKIYEEYFSFYPATRSVCVDDRTGVDGSRIAIEGDNRHIPPFKAKIPKQ